MDEKDYAVKVTVRNGRILRRMRKCGIKTMAQLSRLSGVRQTLIGQFVTMKIAPLLPNGEWRKGVEDVAGALQCDPEDLFSAKQLTLALETNSAEMYMSEPQVERLMSGNPEESTWAKIEAQRLLSCLPEKSRDIVMRRMAGETSEEISKDYNISKTRIIQIEHNAIDKMRDLAEKRIKYPEDALALKKTRTKARLEAARKAIKAAEAIIPAKSEVEPEGESAWVY